MKNLKDKNIKNAVWHIKQHLDELLNSQDEKQRKCELFHL